MSETILIPDVAIRAVWALVIVSAGLLLSKLINRLTLYRAQRNKDRAGESLPGRRTGGHAPARQRPLWQDEGVGSVR